jgi:hypothetical protein
VSSLSLPVAAALPSPSRRWIQSPGFDLAFFVLAPLVTLPLILAILAGARPLMLVGFLLAFAHYLSTFTFFLWDDSRAYHRQRWLAFVGGPLVIVGLFFLLVWLRSPLMQMALLFWNSFHVARQSAGLLSIYRHRDGVRDPRQREVANTALILSSTFFVLWNIDTHKEVFPLLAGLDPRLPRFLWAAFGLASLVAVGRVALAYARRARAGQAPHAPELMTMVMSLALFHPYVWLPDSESATFAMLLAHYLQYLGLVWLVHRRKLAEAGGSLPQQALRFLSRHVLVLVGVLASAGVAFLASKVLLARVGHLEVFEASYLLLAFVHFYLDGLFWAFRDPHVRRSLGPHLMQGVPAELAAVAR